MITLEDYFEKMSRVEGATPPPSVVENATNLLIKVNKLLDAVFSITGIEAAQIRKVNSGWRTPSYNAGISNAAPKSKHMTGDAIDIADPDGDLDSFLATKEGIKLLIEYGLYIESPLATKGWTHLQQLPPRSGKRIFIP